MEAFDKARRVFELRRRGLTYDEIAEEIGCSAALAHKLLHEKMQEIGEQIKVDAVVVRDMEVARLDKLYACASRRAEKGDSQAIAVAIKVAARRSALLGLDAPKRTEITGANGEALLPPGVDLTRLDATQLAALEELLAAARTTDT